MECQLEPFMQRRENLKKIPKHILSIICICVPLQITAHLDRHIHYNSYFFIFQAVKINFYEFL